MSLSKFNSIEQKLGLLFNFSIIFALLISVAGFASTSIYYSFRDFSGELSSIAKVVGATSRTALVFQDKVAGARILSGLSVKENIKYASLASIDGEIIAEYGTAPDGYGFVLAKQEKIEWNVSRVKVLLPIILEGEQVGSLTVISGIESFYEQLEILALITCFIAFLLLAGGSYFRKFLRRLVSDPIISLMQMTQELSATSNFSSRLPTQDEQHDEIAELIKSFNHMMGQIEERNTALVAAKNKAEESDKLKSIFLATVSHELRTPLHAILGMTDEVLQTNVDTEQRSLLEVVRSSGSLLISVINDILDFSKIEAGKLVLIRTPLSIREVVLKVFQLFELSAKNKSVALVLNIHPQVPEIISIDGSRLTQILVNLVGNALKFTSSGSIEIEVKLREENPASKVASLQISVKDTGIGIPDSALHTIFEAFSQVRSKTEHTEGTGLGLAISSKLVQLMGGWIWAESKVGEGSKFHFTLNAEIAAIPAAQSIQKETASTQSPAQQATGDVILAVDDNKVNLLLAERLLQREGYTVLKAWNGQEAVDICKDQKIDLILMDLSMPVMDGLVASKIIREMEAGTGKRVPIIALTANALDEQAHECVSAGMDEYLTKPIERKKLIAVIERLLKNKKN
jgi:signal transduction histidine kinase/ActR/RegA family two-component response regulator